MPPRKPMAMNPPRNKPPVPLLMAFMHSTAETRAETTVSESK